MIAAIERALADLQEPAQPRDGDCLVWAPEIITPRLVAAHLPARNIDVWGWADHEGQVMAFLHRATAVGGFVVDFTARQFSPDLPARWVVWSKLYKLRLAEATHVEAVTLTYGESDEAV